MEEGNNKKPKDVTAGIELNIPQFLKYLSGQSYKDFLAMFIGTDQLVQRIALMEVSPKLDMSNIRADDRPYVHEVIQYLRQNGLRAELKGSATESKEYNDIDILAKGSLEDVANVTRGLNGVTDIPQPFYKTAADGKEYSVAYEGAEVRYMNTPIAQLFRIIVSNTQIHVGLKVKPKDKTPTDDSDPHYFGKAAAAA